MKARRAGTVLGELELKPKGFTDEQKAINKKLDDQVIVLVLMLRGNYRASHFKTCTGVTNRLC